MPPPDECRLDDVGFPIHRDCYPEQKKDPTFPKKGVTESARVLQGEHALQLRAHRDIDKT